MSNFDIWLYNSISGNVTGLADIAAIPALDTNAALEYEYLESDFHILYQFRTQTQGAAATYDYALYDKNTNTVNASIGIPNNIDLYFSSIGQNIYLRKYGASGKAEEIWSYNPNTNLSSAVVTGFNSTNAVVADGDSLVFIGNKKYDGQNLQSTEGANNGSTGSPVAQTSKTTEVTNPVPLPAETEEPRKTQGVIGISFKDAVTDIPLNSPLRIRDLMAFRAIVGTPQADRIIGTNENEVISSGPNKDELIGNKGSDAFIFETPNEFGRANADVVGDFNRKQRDKIGVAKEVVQGVTEVTFQAVRGNSASRRASETSNAFIYDRQKGFLYFNQDGEERGFGTGGLFAILSGAPKMTGTDIAIL